MKVYFSGIGGVGIGPLAEIANDAGYEVIGSDAHEGLMTQELAQRGLTVYTRQDGSHLAMEHAIKPIDWLVHTAALPKDHPELVFAHEHNIRVSKRDEFLAELIRDKHLHLIAVAGTHGKTTTTGMLVWALKQLNIPVSYSVGSKLSFGPSGAFDPKSNIFVYECDEFDRNFLQFHPQTSLITSIDYDHPDTYATPESYRSAFDEFIRQSEHCIMWQQDLADTRITDDTQADICLLDKENPKIRQDIDSIQLAGRHNRENAYLVLTELKRKGIDESDIKKILSNFPGTARRFEKLADGLYSDYGHHPTEIQATLQLARELSDDVVLVYQPHQNIRQHEMHGQYTDKIFAAANKIYWLPTYLTREDPNLPILTPQELTGQLSFRENIYFSQLDDSLWKEIATLRDSGKMVLLMGAGTIDEWARNHLDQRES